MSAEGLSEWSDNWFEAETSENWQLPSNWAQHVLQEARRRRLIVQGLRRDVEGTLVEVAPESLLKASAPITRIRQHLSSSGLLTTVSFCRGGETVGLWFAPADRGPSSEPAWRLLLLETLVLVSGRRPIGG